MICSRLCLTFNVLDKIARIEIILEDNILNSGKPIQLRLKRYLEYTVFHVLIYLSEHNKFEQKSIYVKIPFEFMSSYTNTPFKLNTEFDYFFQLEPELTYKFVNFESSDEKPVKNNCKIDEMIKERRKSNSSTNEMSKKKEKILLTGSSSNNTTGSNQNNQNKFFEQVLPIRGYRQLQIVLNLMINMTDNAETYDGLVGNLDKIVDDENEFLKPLNLIFLGNLNSFDSYFGLNKTLNTSHNFLTDSTVHLIAKVLVKNETTDLSQVKAFLNSTLNDTILTDKLGDKMDDKVSRQVERSVKNNVNLDKNITQQNIEKLKIFNNTLVNKVAVKINNTINNQTIETNLKNKTNQINLKTAADHKKTLANNIYRKIVNINKNYTQIYVGNVDNNSTLSSLPGFVGECSNFEFQKQRPNRIIVK